MSEPMTPEQFREVFPALAHMADEVTDAITQRDAEIARLRTALTRLAVLECNPTRPGTVHAMLRELRTITDDALGGGE